MAYKTLLQLSICSYEQEDQLPIKEVRLAKHIELPIPPQIGLWIQDQSIIHSAIVETVATHGESLIAILKTIQVAEKRIDEVVLDYKNEGWK